MKTHRERDPGRERLEAVQELDRARGEVGRVGQEGRVVLVYGRQLGRREWTLPCNRMSDGWFAEGGKDALLARSHRSKGRRCGGTGDLDRKLAPRLTACRERYERRSARYGPATSTTPMQPRQQPPPARAQLASEPQKRLTPVDTGLKTNISIPGGGITSLCVVDARTGALVYPLALLGRAPGLGARAPGGLARDPARVSGRTAGGGRARERVGVGARAP